MTNTKQKCSADSDLSESCSGCTDPRSEGTHQGCTKEHGHVGCNLSHTEQKGWRESFDKEFDDKIFEDSGRDLLEYTPTEEIKAFIERTLQEETTKAVRAYQEELGKKVGSLVPQFWDTEEYRRDALMYASTEVKRQIIALIKDTKI